MLQKFEVPIERDVFVDERLEVVAVLPHVVDDLAPELQVIAADGLAVPEHLIGQSPEQAVSRTDVAAVKVFLISMAVTFCSKLW